MKNIFLNYKLNINKFLGIISLVTSQSYILKKDVYLIEQIEQSSMDKLLHLKAVYFVRPTDRNFSLCQKELKDPRFCEYYFCKKNLKAFI